MPLGAASRLDELYARQRLVEREAARLEGQLVSPPGEDPDCDRLYMLRLQIRALGEEATKLNAAISDVLDRDLQR
jgi:hypothetical protein